jgi:4-amino-4-deoxy-L-arabinose transferase-like glycosyltransferase
VTLPLALLISFSRVYNGVHFPGDVLAGAVLGAGYTLGGIWTLAELWKRFGPRYFPLWWASLPDLMNPVVSQSGRVAPSPDKARELGLHWLRLGYLFVGTVLLVQLGYLAAGKLDLSEDEAYQWVWSKHLALSYYSKPPLIALTQWLGTHLLGDTQFGIRFFSPVIAAALSVMLLRFFTTQRKSREGFWLVVVLNATPILAAGSILMTVDPILVLFWTAAMIAGWRAVGGGGRLRDWAWAGLWTGLAFLGKYSALFQLVSWAVIFATQKPARAHLRKPGPYLSLLITLLCALPVVIWNSQHGWVTARHVASDGRIGEPWHPTLKYLFDFIGTETALFNPFFAILLILGLIGWAKSSRTPLERYFVSMGAPIFLIHLGLTLHTRVLPNWIGPCIVPFYCFGALRWERLRGDWPRLASLLLGSGLVFGLCANVILHDTGLLQKAFHRGLPARIDPLKRVRGWKELGAALGAKRDELKKRGGEVFFIGDHYGVTGLMSFYVPAAKAAVGDRPLAYYLETGRADNQFSLWPGYHEQRSDENAIFVQSVESPKLVDGWVWRWLKTGDSPDLSSTLPTPDRKPLELLKTQFRHVEDMGILKVGPEGHPIHYFQLYFCEGLNPVKTHE